MTGSLHNNRTFHIVRQASLHTRAKGLERVKLSATTDRREAIAGARYVFCTVRVGASRPSPPTSTWRCATASTSVQRRGDGDGEATMRAEEHAFRLSRGNRA